MLQCSKKASVSSVWHSVVRQRVSLRSASWILSLLWLVSLHMPEPTSLTLSPGGSGLFQASSYLHFYSEFEQMCDMMMSLSHCRETCFRNCVSWWRVELLLVQTLGFFTFKMFWMHKNWCKNLQKEKNTIVPPLILHINHFCLHLFSARRFVLHLSTPVL